MAPTPDEERQAFWVGIHDNVRENSEGDGTQSSGQIHIEVPDISGPSMAIRVPHMVHNVFGPSSMIGLPPTISHIHNLTRHLVDPTVSLKRPMVKLVRTGEDDDFLAS